MKIFLSLGTGLLKNSHSQYIFRIMRLTLFLLLIFTNITFANNANSQNARVNLNEQNATLMNVLENIESQTDYLFVTNRDVNLEQTVSIRAKNKPVHEVLDQLFEKTDLTYAMEGVNIIVSKKSGVDNSTEITQQKRTVTGTVIDNKGEPVPGAIITEKGTENGTMTDAAGNFSLNVNSNAVLSVTYIGYIPQEISVENKSSLKITLQEDTQALSEVIVIGYGTAKRKDFTGAVSSIKLEDSPVALATNLNALEAIKGNVAGLDVGATSTAGGQPSMQMRGQKSISGSNDPLIVLDGVIFMGNLNDINPNDIASYDILKDATSAAAYGSRSANGVIIITTKKGKTGKPIISLNVTESSPRWYNRPKLMNGAQWLESVMARNNSTDLTWLKPQEAANKDAGKETNWFDASTQTGFVQDYQLSISGAGEKMNYYLSTAYSDNKGVIVGDKFNRASVLGKINTDITNWLQIEADAAYTRSQFSDVRANIYQAYVMSPYGVMYRDEQNKLLEKYPYTQSGVNPLWGIDDGTRDNTNYRDNFRLNASALIKLPWMPELSYRLNYTGNLSKEYRSNFYHETYYVKEGAYDDPTRYSPATYQSLLSNANGNIDNRNYSSWVIDNILNYNKKFGNHSIDLTAVATRDLSNYDYQNITGNDFSANGNTTLGVNGLSKATVQKVSLDGWKRTNIGYLGRASYSYSDKYFLTGSIRRDGASVFGANQKWGNFVAFGGAWRVTEEKFMNNLSFLNNLKLKLSWGKNGNQGLAPYGTLSTINNGASANARYEFGSSTIWYGMVPGTLGNSNLGWESTASWNTGLESAWLNNRIFFDVDLYFSQTTNQIFDRNIPVMTGFKTMKSSMGQINNSGVEITLRTVNIENKEWGWTSNFTFWLNRNKLVHLYGDLDENGKEKDDVANSRFIGKPLGAIYGYLQDGIVQTTDADYMQKNGVKPGVPKYKDLTGEGTITADDRTILGYSTPNFKLNMSNTVTYKNFELYAMLTGTFGGGGYYLKSNTRAYMTNGSGLFNSNSIYVPYWTTDNPSNVYPSAVFTGDGGRFQGLQSRAFVRLQDVTLSYTFNNTSWVKNMKIHNLKLFLTAKNLFTITNWVGIDPEVGSTIADSTYPVLTTFSIGANISF